MNGKIVKENTAINLMENYRASNLEDLLIEVILTEDDQRDHVSIMIYCFLLVII